MAIVGIGTDIVALARIEKVLERNPAFAERVLTGDELETYAQAGRPAALVAKRFAAKEAAAKALGTGIAQGVSFQHIEVRHTALGQPLLHLSAAALQRANTIGATAFHLSISDEADYAMAYVILESD
ncbi:holo-ACP synthase [Aliidiomarina minuta]|uniref:Holo-[acyl-carrier-protein] synthase n=1 Tax=Aliidiomarina minuta TaxID=880057 RepID=A0A432W6X0_9GAMM|nr:holo-ACP synthase [Aliidiomarina minuta]RUO25820.1 holo-ACP synthase [Aliidiomarina minuta]